MEITTEKVLAVCGGIACIGSAWAVIQKWLAPAIRCSNRLTEVEKKQRKDSEAIEDIQKCNQLLCKGMLALMESELSGSDNERLKRAKDEMQEYLIER